MVMKNMKGPVEELQSMRHISVVIDTTHGLIHFPLLTMQDKNAAREASAKPHTSVFTIA